MEPKSSSSALPVVMSVAGFDPTSGAGLTADLKTFAAHNCYGVGAVSAITLQTTVGVRGVEAVAPHLLAEQICEVAEDVPIAAVKLGMIGSAENVNALADALDRFSFPYVVLDPVFRSTSGATLLDDEGVEHLRARLLPKVTVMTPNIEEAARITGQSVQCVDDMKAASAVIFEKYGARSVITGGHLDKPQDVFFDGCRHTVFAGDRIRSENTHGTGCAFSSAIAANLALGKSLPDAIVLAKAYVTQAIEKGHPIGKGHGILNHLYRIYISAPPRTITIDTGGDVNSASGHRK